MDQGEHVTAAFAQSYAASRLALHLSVPGRRLTSIAPESGAARISPMPYWWAYMSNAHSNAHLDCKCSRTFANEHAYDQSLATMIRSWQAEIVSV